MVKVILEQCRYQIKDKAIVIFKNNAAAVAQVATGFIKADLEKLISPTLFGYMQGLVESNQVKVTKIESAKNIFDMLIKALPAYRHHKLVRVAKMRTLNKPSPKRSEEHSFLLHPRHKIHKLTRRIF